MRNQSEQYKHHQQKQRLGMVNNYEWLFELDDNGVSRYWSGVLYSSMAFYVLNNASTYVSINVSPQDGPIYASFLADCGTYINSIRINSTRNAFRFTNLDWVNAFSDKGYSNLIKQRSLSSDGECEINVLREYWANSWEFIRGYFDAAGMYRCTKKFVKFSVSVPEAVLIPMLRGKVLCDIPHDYQAPRSVGNNARVTFFDDHMQMMLKRLGYGDEQSDMPSLPSVAPIIELLKYWDK